jgi:hypothetical protein
VVLVVVEVEHILLDGHRELLVFQVQLTLVAVVVVLMLPLKHPIQVLVDLVDLV